MLGGWMGDGVNQNFLIARCGPFYFTELRYFLLTKLLFGMGNPNVATVMEVICKKIVFSPYIQRV